MKFPNEQPSVGPEVPRLLSDAALYQSGARFVDGHFVITDRQYETLQHEGMTPQEVPFGIASHARPLVAARAVLKQAYFADKAESIAAQLETDTDPTAYLEGIRAYVRSVSVAPTDTEPYKQLCDKPHNMAPAYAANLQFAPLVMDKDLPPGMSKTALAFTPGHLARQIDRLFTMSSGVAALTSIGEALALANKPQGFQEAVMDQFLTENLCLLELVINTGSADKVDAAAQSNALFCNGISVLETALHDFPNIEPSKIVMAFMRRSIHFMQFVRQFQTTIENKTAATKQAKQTRQRAPQQAAQQKRAKKLWNQANRIRRDTFRYNVPPLGGEQLVLPDPKHIPDALFSGVAALERSLGIEYGSSTWEAWQLLPEQSPVEQLTNHLLTLDAPVRCTIVALPTEPVLRQMAQRKPRLAKVQPEHAVRMNLVCTVDQPQGRQHFLMDVLYFATNAEEPGSRRYHVISSGLINDKDTLSRYLLKLRAQEGEVYAQTIRQAFNREPLQKTRNTMV